jgi:hypothetical protein
MLSNAVATTRDLGFILYRNLDFKKQKPQTIDRSQEHQRN